MHGCKGFPVVYNYDTVSATVQGLGFRDRLSKHEAEMTGDGATPVLILMPTFD